MKSPRKLLTMCTVVAGLLGTTALASAQTISVDAKALHAEADVTILSARILSRWAPVAQAAGVDLAVWQEQYAIQFSRMSADALQRLDTAAINDAASAREKYAVFTQAFRGALMTSYVQAQAAGSSKGNLKLGLAGTDQVFVPIVPCRIVDTRNVGGPISANTARNYFAWSTTTGFSWSSQGGAAGASGTACPGTVNPGGGATFASVSAAVATVTVVSPSAGGNFVAWEGASPVPLTSVLNWANPGDIAANTTVIPNTGTRTGTGPGGALKDFAILYNGPSGVAQVVIDVVGYFVQSTATALDCVTVLGTTANVLAGANYTAGASCGAGYTVTGGGQLTSTFTPLVSDSKQSGNGWSCQGNNTNSGSVSVTCEAICCRVPGR